MSWWTSFGAVMSTTSTRGSATTSRQSALQRAKPRLRAAASAQAGLTSATISSTGTAGSGPNTMGTFRYATACALPIQPAPISPMRTSVHRRSPQLAQACQAALCPSMRADCSREGAMAAEGNRRAVRRQGGGDHRRHPGARRGDRAAVRGARRRRHRDLRAQRRARRARRARDQRHRLPDRVRPRRPRAHGRWPQLHRQRRGELRPARHPGELRGGDRSRHDREHHRGDLGQAVHAQRQVAVLPDPARGRGDAPAPDRRARSRTSAPWSPTAGRRT